MMNVLGRRPIRIPATILSLVVIVSVAAYSSEEPPEGSPAYVDTLDLDQGRPAELLENRVWIPEITYPYDEPIVEKLPWPHQRPGLSEDEIEALNHNIWVINNHPLYQASANRQLRVLHDGLDIVLPNGTPIYAMKAGWVKAITYSTITIADTPGEDPAYGWGYTHLGNHQVQVGEFVPQGTWIGDVEFYGLPHIHLSKRFSEGRHWGVTHYMCLPDGHFSYSDDEPPVISTPFYFFYNGSDAMIPPDASGTVVLRGQADIVVGMREQGLYARSNESGFGDRLAVTRIDYTIRPVRIGLALSRHHRSFDFRQTPVRRMTTYYTPAFADLVFKHWFFFEPDRISYDKVLSYYVITNTPPDSPPAELDPLQSRHSWKTAKVDESGKPLYPNGEYDILVTAEDSLGHSAAESMRVSVQNDWPQDSPPVACVRGGNVEAEAGADCRAVIVLDGSCSEDDDSTTGTNDDILLFEWFEGYGQATESLLGRGDTLRAALPPGDHSITLRTTDSFGKADTETVIVSVVDTWPPDIVVDLAPELLWPPNHRLVEIRVNVSATDNCGMPAVLLVSATSNEPDDAKGTGDGETSGDVQEADIGTADFVLKLRAERSGASEGRIYVLKYSATDDSGNSSEAAGSVFVPHLHDGAGKPWRWEVVGEATKLADHD